MELTHYLSAYLADRPGLSAGYAAHLLRLCRQFAEWSGEPVTLASLSRPMAADFLRHRLACGDSPVTVNNKRRQLRTLWLAAAEDGLAPSCTMPRKLPEPQDPPEAWTVEEVGELLWTAAHWPGNVGSVPAAVWWPSLLAVAYWTGARIGSLLCCRQCDYSDGWLTIRGANQKNRRGQRLQLPGHGRSRVDRLVAYRTDPLWLWPHCRRYLFAVCRRIVELAGLPCPKAGRQLFHRLRRTNLSYCAAADLALAQRQAGHASAETTRRHYLDPRISGERQAAAVLPVPAF